MSSEVQFSYWKRLEGVRWNEPLANLLNEAVAQARDVVDDDTVDTVVDDTVPDLTNETNADRVSSSSSSSSSSPILLPELSMTQAKQIIIQFAENERHKDSTSTSTTAFIPIQVIRSMAVILSSPSPYRGGKTRLEPLESCLSSTSLAFTRPPPEATNDLSPEQVKFRQRLQRLRNKEQESHYKALVHNVGGEQQEAALASKSDVTTRSMTYAASIGLNMIIAPLSFGCFMYFFAGGLLDYFFPEDETSINHRHNHNVPKIGRLLVGVISGVLMMFIEMILFVIRTHEMDKAIRKKSKKQQVGAFGFYTAETVKTYKED